ncbi:MAG: TerC/Alx family metal homeostasis membrane protein [Gammaproteobacteria bacterium]
MDNIANGWMWLGFTIFVFFALYIDHAVQKNHGPAASVRLAVTWTLVWVLAALSFNAFLWGYLYLTTSPTFAYDRALKFFTGYLIEKSLSIDNLFAFYMIFKQFHIPIKYQQRVFSIGIWSAIILRLLVILLFTWLVTQFHWLLLVMGGFLVLTGLKMALMKEKEKDLTESLTIRLLKRFFRITNDFDDHHFFTRKNGLLFATPLFITLIFIEMSDIIFAFDSIPAIFSITRDPFIVWSSNIFAILGLRALYFLLARMAERFHLLKYGIAIILMYVGVKLMIAPWWHIEVTHSLAVIALVLISFVSLSLWYRPKHEV